MLTREPRIAVPGGSASAVIDLSSPYDDAPEPGIARLLTELGTSGKLAVCSRRPGDARLQAATGSVKWAIARIEKLGALGEHDVYFGANRLGRVLPVGQRGKAADVTRVTCMYADLDAGKPDSPPTIDACWHLTGDIRRSPRFLVFSGHGIQPIWPVAGPEFVTTDPARRDDIARLARRWGQMISDIAAGYGWKIDPVFDLSRVLRAPGTVNVKDPEHPVRASLEINGGRPLTYADVCDLLDEHESYHPRRARPRSSYEQNGSNDDLERTPAYGLSVLKALLEEDAPSRHRWMIHAVYRVHELAAQGHLDDLQSALDAIGDRFSSMIKGDTMRASDPGEFARAVAAAEAKSGITAGPQASQEQAGDETPDDRAETSPPADDDDFWGQRPLLGLIRDWARARRAGPYAVLGEVLARVVCRVPPAVQLPPVVGGNGSLNMLIALVGKPGTGKGAAALVTGAAIDWGFEPPVDAFPLGSGEGLAKVFGHGQTTEGVHQVVRDRYRAVIVIPEVDTFAAQTARNGATISAQLRQAYSGEGLGFAYSDATKRVMIEGHSYRLTVVAGVQPGRGNALLDGTDGGLPQRFVWLPAGDPAAPAARPPDPVRIRWERPAALKGITEYDTSPYLLPVCAEACSGLDAARVAQLHGKTDELDTHGGYTRLKLAAAFGLLDGRAEVSASDWELAGRLMTESDRTRGSVTAALQQVSARRNTARAHADAARAEIVAGQLADAAIKRVCGIVRRKLAKADGPMSRRELRDAVSRDREWLADALGRLEAAGDIVARDGGYRLRPARS